MPLGKCWLLILRTYETQNYTLQQTAEILQVTAGRMYFIAGLKKCQIFLSVLLTCFTESAFSSWTKSCVMKKTTSLTVIFSIYCENLSGTQKYSPYQNGGFLYVTAGRTYFYHCTS
jgi:hypothetical protein